MAQERDVPCELLIGYKRALLANFENHNELDDMLVP